jgi:hypothetical protein
MRIPFSDMSIHFQLILLYLKKTATGVAVIDFGFAVIGHLFKDRCRCLRYFNDIFTTPTGPRIDGTVGDQKLSQRRRKKV